MGDEQSPSRDAMTIRQLSEESGVPVRRIRHFIAEGLMPPPYGRGRAAHYRREHLQRIQQIQAMRDVNLGLEEIRRRLGEPVQRRVGGEPIQETWRRWEIVPGIELHVRADLDPALASMARVLANVARQLIAAEPGPDDEE